MGELKEIIREAIEDVEREAEVRKSARPNGEARDRQETPPEPVVIPLANVEPEEVSWLWEPYLPAGKLTIVEGDPGAGKTWVTLAICAKLTAEGHSVLYATAEDGLADTIRPRVEGVGADLNRFYVLRGVKKDGETLPFTLGEPRALEKAILTYRPALVVLDPVQGFLGGSVDMHKANEVRSQLAPLARIAETYGCAVVVVRHLSKAPAGRAIYRGLGSIDFTAAARSVLLVGQTPDKGRAVVHLKNSVGELGPSLGFEFQHGQFFWRGEVDTKAGDILAPDAPQEDKTALDEAMEWLQEVLSEGPATAKEVLKAAKEAGIAERTLYRAKARLSVQVKRDTRPGEKTGPWVWILSPEDGFKVANRGNLEENPSKYILGNLEEVDENLTAVRLSDDASRLPYGNLEGDPSNPLGSKAEGMSFKIAKEYSKENSFKGANVGNVENQRDVLQPADRFDTVLDEIYRESKGRW